MEQHVCNAQSRLLSQGVVKGALVHVKEATAGRCRELGEEGFALRDRLDAARHTLTERAEESSALGTQVGMRSVLPAAVTGQLVPPSAHAK